MRIVDVCAFYTPAGGGVKTYVEQKLRAGAKAGHEIIILAPGTREQETASGPGARIVTLPAPRFPLDRRYHYFDDEARLHAMLDALAPDVVEASSPWSSAAMVGRWRGNVPRSLVMHADPLSAYAYRWFGPVASRAAIDRGFDWYWRHLRRLDACFDTVLCASESLSARLRAGGLSRVKTLPMGVEPGLFAPGRRNEALRARLLRACALGPDATLLLGIGRHAAEKRWPMVIEAVTAAGYDRPVGLVLVGDGRDRAKVMRAAAHNPHIHLAAPIANRAQLAALLASGDALVHGCESETFCMVAAEARASGLPLIVPDQGGALDHARAGAGFTYAAGQSASLAKAIGDFISQGPAALRARAGTLAPQAMTMDGHFEGLFSAYARLPIARRDAA